MLGLFRQAKLRAKLAEPSHSELADFIECFNAGFCRGFDDVHKSVPAQEWVSLVVAIARRLAGDRSLPEAGAWLAGLFRGRDFAINNPQEELPVDIERHFYEAFDAGSVEECARLIVSKSPPLLTAIEKRAERAGTHNYPGTVDSAIY